MAVNNDIRPPLNGLITVLEREGFEISTRTILDIQKVLANLDEEVVKDTAHLKLLLGPLICRNKEEQEKFYKLFGEFEAGLTAKVSEIAGSIIEEQVKKKEAAIKKRKKEKLNKRIIIGSSILLLLLITGVILYLLSRPPTEEQSKIRIITNLSEIIKDEPVVFSAELNDTSASRSYTVNWQIGDTTYINQRVVQKVFNQPGDYEIKASRIENSDIKDTINTTFSIEVLCERPPSASIQKDTKEAGPGPLTYRPVITNGKGNDKYIYTWLVNDSFRTNGRVFSYEPSKPGAFIVKVIVEDTAGIHCDGRFGYFTAEFSEVPELALSVQGGKPLLLSNQWNEKYFISLILFCLIMPFILVRLLYKDWVKELTGRDDKSKPPAGNVTGKKEYTGPYSIGFKPQEDKIAPEIAINQLAEILRKRHISDVYRLNIRKTIRNTIKKGGFPNFEFSPRTKPTDFLIFIDEEYPGSHLLKLYRYVIDQLKKEQVNLTVYSYYREPLLLSNEALNHLILPVDKIARLYPGTILFLFTNADAFFKPMDVQLHDWVTEKFKSWNSKLIFTSVPKNDWGRKELALYNAGFTVVPADVNAHQLISDEINQMLDKQKLKKAIIPATYSARRINFNNWQQVKKYLEAASNQNSLLHHREPGYFLLKEWLCATAVYPYVNWDVTLAVGRAIEEKKSGPGKLVNYSNLLVLGRIQWLQDGQLTESMRMEMLRELDAEILIIAREAVGQLLEEIKGSITEGSLVSEEYKLHTVTNRFLLRNYKGEQIDYKDEDYQAIQSYAENDQLDWPIDIVLNMDPNNTSLKGLAGDTSSVRLKEFIEGQKKEQRMGDEKVQLEIKKKKKVLFRKAAILLASLVVISTILLSTAFKVKPRIYPPAADRVITFSSINSTGNTVNSISIYLNGKEFTAKNITTDSFSIEDLPTDSLYTGIVTLTLNNPVSGSQSFTGVVSPGFENYNLSLAEPGGLVPLSIRYNNEAAYREKEQQLKSSLTEYEITALQNTIAGDTVNRVIYYEENKKAAADSVAEIVRSLINRNVEVKYVNQPGTVMEVFIHFKKDTVLPDVCTPASLPQSLNEIWTGGGTKRLININLEKRMVYYSTGDKKTYGTYRIIEVCRINSSSYKIITSTGSQYRVFIINNVSGSSFSLSVCQNLYSTLDDARKINEVNCDHFNTMSLYYEVNPSRIFLPVNPNNIPRLSQDKIRRLNDSVRNYENLGYDVQVSGILYHSPAFKWKVPDAFPVRITRTVELNEATPFDRSYVEYTITRTRDDNPNCSVTYMSIADTRKLRSPLIVCRLDLSGQNLAEIPKEVYDFKNLQYLDLRNNRIYESDIKKLRENLPPKNDVRYDVIADCRTTFSSIRETMNVSPGTVCRLKLSGSGLKEVPKELYQFTNLQELNISNNELTNADSIQLHRSFPKANILFTPQKRQPALQKWILIRQVTLDPKNYPLSQYDNFFELLDAELKKNPNARIKIVAFYNLKENPRQAEAMIKGVQSYLKKYSWDRYYDTKRVVTEVSNDVNKSEQVSSLIFFDQNGESGSISVYGLNISPGFNSSLGRDTRTN